MLLEKHISQDSNSKTLVLFGGNPQRRDQVIRSLMHIPSLNIFGTLSEAEGLMAIEELPNVDIVLIGGRYTAEQRKRIKAYLAAHHPQIKTTEPGIDYAYDEGLIKEQVLKMLK